MRVWLVFAIAWALDVSHGGLEGYFTYDEVVDTLTNFTKHHSTCISEKFSIGSTVENRSIWALRLNSTTLPTHAKGTLLLMAAHHAKELISVSFALWAFDHLLTSNTSMAHYLLQTRNIILVPIVNTDSYFLISDHYRAKGEILELRKNRRPEGCGNPEAEGVDLNRNYGVDWGLDSGSSSHPCDEDYRGPNSFSEPETRAIRDLLTKEKPQTALSYHSWGDLYVIPFGTKKDASPSVFRNADDYYFYRNLSTALPPEAMLGTPYQTVSYLADGLFIDYAYEHGVKGIAVELGPRDFHPPVSTLQGIFQKHYKPLEFVLQRTGSWLSFTVNASKSDDVVSVEIEVQNWGLMGDFDTKVEIQLDFNPVVRNDDFEMRSFDWRNQTNSTTELSITTLRKTLSLHVPEFPPRSTSTLTLYLQSPDQAGLYSVSLVQTVQQPGLNSIFSRTEKLTDPTKVWLGATLFGIGMTLLVCAALLVRKYRRDIQPLQHIELSNRADY